MFRAFADEGGVRSFLMARRLKTAREALAVAPAGRGEISRLAEELGFASTAHFSDAFLDRHGIRPSAVSSKGQDGWPDSRHLATAPVDLQAMCCRAAEVYGRFTG